MNKSWAEVKPGDVVSDPGFGIRKVMSVRDVDECPYLVEVQLDSTVEPAGFTVHQNISNFVEVLMEEEINKLPWNQGDSMKTWAEVTPGDVVDDTGFGIRKVASVMRIEDDTIKVQLEGFSIHRDATHLVAILDDATIAELPWPQGIYLPDDTYVDDSDSDSDNYDIYQQGWNDGVAFAMRLIRDGHRI